MNPGLIKGLEAPEVHQRHAMDPVLIQEPEAPKEIIL